MDHWPSSDQRADPSECQSNLYGLHQKRRYYRIWSPCKLWRDKGQPFCHRGCGQGVRSAHLSVLWDLRSGRHGQGKRICDGKCQMDPPCPCRWYGYDRRHDGYARAVYHFRWNHGACRSQQAWWGWLPHSCSGGNRGSSPLLKKIWKAHCGPADGLQYPGKQDAFGPLHLCKSPWDGFN